MASGNRRCESQSLGLLGEVDCARGEHERGLERMHWSAELARETGFVWWEAGMLGKLFDREREQGLVEEATAHARGAVELSRELGDRLRMVRGLARLVIIAAGEGDLRRAGRLWGAVEAEEVRGPIGAWENERERFERELPGPDPEFRAGVAEGRRLSLDEAVPEALAV